MTSKGKEELISIVQQDILEELSFDIKGANSGYLELFQALKHCSKLKTLLLNVKPSMIWILNKGLNKEISIKTLKINFAIETTEHFELKFPKYLKHLRSLTLNNIADKNLTDTLMDMASLSRINELTLGFV